jgi:hypothetical protein
MLHGGHPHINTHYSHSGERPFHVFRPQPPIRLPFAILNLHSRALTATWILTITRTIATGFSKNEEIEFTLAGRGWFLGLISLPGACKACVKLLVRLTFDFSFFNCEFRLFGICAILFLSDLIGVRLLFRAES